MAEVTLKARTLNVQVTVIITKEFWVRAWAARQLIALAFWILGGKVKFE